METVASSRSDERRPVVIGLGGTTRPDSTTERALSVALRAAEAAGASTVLLGGGFLATLPIFDPRLVGPTSSRSQLIDAVAQTDGAIERQLPTLGGLRL